MKEIFVPRKFSGDILGMIAKVNAILDDYARQGYDLTLRQAYYQVVAHDLFPDDRRWSWVNNKWVRDANGTKNAEPNYKWLGEIINNGRLAGLIDWDRIEDRGRNLAGLSHWTTPADIIRSAANGFRIDKWTDQKYRVEVWVEKEALVGVVERICNEHDVPYFACKGYVSQSEMWGAGKRLAAYRDGGQTPFVIHLGDHDPSGIDMSRDIRDRIEMFAEGEVVVDRIALTMAQVQQYGPPPNPTKLTDSRCGGYIDRFGEESWELDALDPTTLSDLIRESIESIRDPDQWDEDLAKESAMKDSLRATSRHWPKVAQYVKALP